MIAHSVENPLLEAALKFARYGWHVFPVFEPSASGCSCGNANCESPAKHPRTDNGLLDATTDAGRITAWWQRWPTASIGIATEPSGLLVLDVDPRHAGDESLRALVAEHGDLHTAIVVTGGGGEHYYFKTRESFKSRANALGKEKYPGIDVRSRGGYVLAPPSHHISGGEYAFEFSSTRKLATVPNWLSDLLQAQDRTPIVGADNHVVIIAGERNNALARLAGRLRRQGLGVEALTDALLAMNARQVQPPLPEREVRQIAMSIGRYAPAEVPTSIYVPIFAEELSTVDVSDVPDPDDSDVRRYELGVANIDRGMGKIRPTDFMVIGARQGHGKTALAETLAIVNAVKYRVMFASLEMPLDELKERMIGKIMRASVEDVERLRILKDPQYAAAKDSLESLNLVFYRPTKRKLRTSDAVMQAAEQNRADILIADYTRSYADWRVGNSDACSEIVGNLSQWTKDRRITLVQLCQMNREAQERRPIESQLQDCGRLEQEATKVILLYRKFKGNKRNDTVAEIIVAKNRRGPEFRGHAYWTAATTSFHSMTIEEDQAALCCRDKGAK